MEYTLTMPRGAVAIDTEEMTYVEGGAVSTKTGTAKYLKGQASALMAAWASLAGGYTYAAALSASTGAGIGIGVIAGIGAGYCSYAANEYRKAYNYFSLKSQTSSTKYKMSTVTFLSIITGVSYGLA